MRFVCPHIHISLLAGKAKRQFENTPITVFSLDIQTFL